MDGRRVEWKRAGTRRRGAGAPRFGRAVRAVVLAFTLLVSPAISAQEAVGADPDKRKGPPKTWHCTAYVRGEMGIRVIDYWSRGDDMVARTLIKGRPIVTIVAGGRYVAYDAISGEGVDIARSPAAIALDAERVRPFAFELEEIKAAGGEKVEDVVLGAMKGEVWQVRDRSGRRKLWVSTGVPSVPLRVETFDRSTGQTVELDYQGWTLDMPLPDRFFTPPGGLSLMRFDQSSWLERAPGRAVPNVPILYPDLLFGRPAG